MGLSVFFLFRRRWQQQQRRRRPRLQRNGIKMKQAFQFNLIYILIDSAFDVPSGIIN